MFHESRAGVSADDGLAFRRRIPMPRKRGEPDGHGTRLRRRVIYRLRYQISAWSHRVFWLARRLKRPALYLRWARAAAAVYHGFAYYRGRIGGIVKLLRIK